MFKSIINLFSINGGKKISKQGKEQGKEQGKWKAQCKEKELGNEGYLNLERTANKRGKHYIHNIHTRSDSDKPNKVRGGTTRRIKSSNKNKTKSKRCKSRKKNP
tara:strand:+ start:696 stop:1007 length:312 start_codon:yes stop_codon:yes gene_type:complete